MTRDYYAYSHPRGDGYVIYPADWEEDDGLTDLDPVALIPNALVRDGHDCRALDHAVREALHPPEEASR